MTFQQYLTIGAEEHLSTLDIEFIFGWMALLSLTEQMHISKRWHQSSSGVLATPICALTHLSNSAEIN